MCILWFRETKLAVTLQSHFRREHKRASPDHKSINFCLCKDVEKTIWCEILSIQCSPRHKSGPYRGILILGGKKKKSVYNHCAANLSCNCNKIFFSQNFCNNFMDTLYYFLGKSNVSIRKCKLSLLFFIQNWYLCYSPMLFSTHFSPSISHIYYYLDCYSTRVFRF